MEMDGVDLEFEPDALKAIAAKAIARKSGARGLRAIIEDALMGTMFDLPSRSDVAKVVVTPEVIAEGKEPTLVPGEPKRKLPRGQDPPGRRHHSGEQKAVGFLKHHDFPISVLQ